ncbi:MAG: adenosylcobalamin-dependent ribonucleoside-diphosphate reductase [Bacteroidales bacterium]|nr:adenosylcobalamin-dependent ribonucleoside-diphosphate reductase [Bacteroidales bacterium]
MTPVEVWLDGNKLGVDIWHKKYQRNGETFDEWLDRVSGGDWAVRELIVDKKFLFGGRILSNRGVTDEKVTYSNCYVISPPDDNLESIYDCVKKLARTYSYGGGCGIDISNLAPAGAKVNNQAKTTSGAVSFMDTFSQVTQQIGQNGRRGALMISIDCTHPDLEKFILVKQDLQKVNSANISVRVSDDFMRAVEQDADWELSFTRKETGEVISKTVKAREVFKALCYSNWNYAEPGILFWDLIRHYNMLNEYDDFSYAGVNPCAEEPLPAGGSCLLGSLNLSAFVENGEFNFHEFERAVRIAVGALNTVLDEGCEKHPLEEQRQSVRDWRQIGLGVMGIADMLIKLGLRYGSEESIAVCDKIGFSLAQTAIEESLNLAMLHGCFPKCDKEKITKSPYIFCNIKSELIVKEIAEYGLRNSQLLTIAPTGTLSTMLGISGGIEPIFSNSYTRKTQSLHGKDTVYTVYTPIVEKYMKEHGISDEKLLPEYFVTAKDITPEERIAMQGIWQDHIDASISSTINLPNSATVDDVYKIYMTAWKEGLKGITVYRAGCARDGVLVDSTEKPKKPVRTIGLERHLVTGCGSLHVCAFFDEEGNLKNTYLSKGSSGGCNNFMIGLSRMISLAAREGVGIHAIVDQLKSSGTCPSYAVRRATKCDTSDGSSCPVAVGNALIDMWNEIKKTEKRTENITANLCPECGAELVEEMGCVTCKHCGYSRCG